MPKELVEHKLKVNPNAKPKKQHLHRSTEDRKEAIKKELSKLLAAWFIKKVHYPRLVI